MSSPLFLYRVGPAVNAKVNWHGDDGSHAGEEPKKDVKTIEPKISGYNVHA